MTFLRLTIFAFLQQFLYYNFFGFIEDSSVVTFLEKGFFVWFSHVMYYMLGRLFFPHLVSWVGRISFVAFLFLLSSFFVLLPCVVY